MNIPTVNRVNTLAHTLANVVTTKKYIYYSIVQVYVQVYMWKCECMYLKPSCDHCADTARLNDATVYSCQSCSMCTSQEFLVELINC